MSKCFKLNASLVKAGKISAIHTSKDYILVRSNLWLSMVMSHDQSQILSHLVPTIFKQIKEPRAVIYDSNTQSIYLILTLDNNLNVLVYIYALIIFAFRRQKSCGTYANQTMYKDDDVFGNKVYDLWCTKISNKLGKDVTPFLFVCSDHDPDEAE